MLIFAQNKVRLDKKFTFPQAEKLKSSKAIDELFVSGKSFVLRPIRLVYKQLEEESKIKVAFSCSKKNYKKAVDRNLVKRRMREAYRLNKHILTQKNLHIIFLYTDKKIRSFEEIQKAMLGILQQLN